MSIETNFYRIADAVSKKTIEIADARYKKLITDPNYLKEYRGDELRGLLGECDPIVFWMATFGYALDMWMVTTASQSMKAPEDRSSKSPLRHTVDYIFDQWRDMKETLNKRKK